MARADTAEALSKLKVAELKERLKERGLKVSGRKAELVERLLQNGAVRLIPLGIECRFVCIHWCNGFGIWG